MSVELYVCVCEWFVLYFVENVIFYRCRRKRKQDTEFLARTFVCSGSNNSMEDTRLHSVVYVAPKRNRERKPKKKIYYIKKEKTETNVPN